MFRPGGRRWGSEQKLRERFSFCVGGEFALGQAWNRGRGHLSQGRKIVFVKLSLDLACPCLPCQWFARLVYPSPCSLPACTKNKNAWISTRCAAILASLAIHARRAELRKRNFEMQSQALSSLHHRFTIIISHPRKIYAFS